MKKSLKASLIAVAIASFPFGSQAAGLGQISVLSGLGQPLRAEIQINATPQELQSLRARLASPEAFRQANIPYSPVIQTLRAALENRGQRAIVKLSSDRPINDPFVDLLIELDWNGGRLSREYTFLLDPVDLVAPKPLAARVDTPAAAPAPRAARPQVPAPAATASQAGDGGSYRVQRGDTLRRIAESNRPADATLDQMLVALFRSNPAAFDGSNINRLKTGAILSMPAPSEVQAVDRQEARREIVAQAADFDAYRRKLASSVVERPAEAPTAQSGAGLIVPRVEAPATAPSGDKVQVSRTQPGEQGSTEAAHRLQALEEELVSREKALDEANARLAQLEQNIREMQKLLQLKSDAMAQQQANAGGAPAATASAPAPGTEAAAQAAAPAAADAQPPKAAEPPPRPKPRAVAPPPPEPEPDLLQSLTQDPTMLAAGGGIVVLLLAYAGLRMRKGRKPSGAGETSALMSEFPPESSAVFGGTGGQSVDTSNSSLIHTDFSQSGLSSIDADEGVDPVAEADVYMAYGRDAQAEEILLDALKTDPERLAIPLKLLEIYSKRKNAKQFETIASELYARTGGKGLDWEKTALMGRKLDPENPLYSSKTIEPERTEAPSTEMPAAVGAAALGAAALAASAQAASTEESAALELSNLDFTISTPGNVDAATQEMTATWTSPGALDQFSEAAGGDEPPVEQLAAGGAAAEEITSFDVRLDSLDFDLDLDKGEDEGKANDAPAVVDSEVAGASDLMLNLDIGGEEPPVARGSGEEVDSSAGGGNADFGTVTVIGKDLDFSATDTDGLAFDLPEVDAVQAETPDRFDLNATVVQADGFDAEGAVDAAMTDLENTGFDSNLLDFDFDLDASTKPAPAEPAGLDLTSIDLNLEPSADGDLHLDTAPAMTDALPALDGLVAGGGDGEIDHEVETKLELARAYEEMGDKEGARELLDEVLREGSAGQQATARELIAKLG